MGRVSVGFALLMGILFSGGHANAISDSLVSRQFESDVAAKAVASLAQIHTIKELLDSIPTGNRNDAYYMDEVVKQFGAWPLPQVTVSEAVISLNYGKDHSQIEVISSLERAYFINEIKLQMSSSESLQDAMERLERVYKLRKKRFARRLLFWQILFGSNEVQAEDKTLEDHAILWSAIAVGVENKVAAQAKTTLTSQLPTTGKLAQSLQKDFGPHTKYEISCRPRYININDSDKSAPYNDLLSQCCKDADQKCAYVLNSMSESANPSIRGQSTLSASDSSGTH